MRSVLFVTVIILLPVFATAQSTEALQVFETAVADSRQGDHLDALEGFTRTLSIIERANASDSFTAKVHYNIGVSLYQLGLSREASVQLKSALRYSRNRHAQAQYLLGLVSIELNELDAAKTALRTAVALDNRDGNAWYDLGRVYLSLNDPEKARVAFAKAVKRGVEARSGEETVARIQNVAAAYE